MILRTDQWDRRRFNWALKLRNIMSGVENLVGACLVHRQLKMQSRQ